MTEPATDPLLLGVSRRVLSARGFRIRESQLDGLVAAPWLLAENDYFLLGLTAGSTLDDLRVLEGYVAAEMNQLLEKAELGPKRWDSYVVLLGSSDADKRGDPDLLRLQYNTRSLRRVVSLGVQASEEAVSRALTAFLPLPDPPAGGLPSPFEGLLEQLIINGVARERAVQAVATYRYPSAESPQ